LSILYVFEYSFICLFPVKPTFALILYTEHSCLKNIRLSFYLSSYLSIYIPTYLSINVPIYLPMYYLSVICVLNSQVQVFVSNGVRVPQLPAHSLCLSRSKPTCAADGAPLPITVNLHSPLWGVATSCQPNLECIGAVWQTSRICRGIQCLDNSHLLNGECRSPSQILSTAVAFTSM